MSNSPNRSYEKIEMTDLFRVFPLARECLIDMLERNQTGRFYQADDALACLSQGAAQHFVFGDRGVQDWDIVFFFPKNPRWKFPPRWRGTRDFGPSRFGRNPDDGPKFVGRRVDAIGRDIPMLTGQDMEQAVIAYLRAGHTKSARLWAKRPLVKLANDDSMGRIIWHPTA
jgi:hypothetical protein